MPALLGPGAATVAADTPRARRACAGLLVLLSAAAGVPAQAQTPDPRPPFLWKVTPTGVRSYVTEGWGTVDFGLSNTATADLNARVLTYYPGAPDRQYGRDVWVPPRATLWSWYGIGPPPKPPERDLFELRTLLYDRTGGQDRLLKDPDGKPYHSQMVRYLKRESGTVVMLDTDLEDGTQANLPAEVTARSVDVKNLARLVRHSQSLSERISRITQRFLPPAAEALDGVDLFLLGTDRLADDAAGLRTLRGWVARGGNLWVMLDLAGPRTVSALLGDDLTLQVVDRVTLNRIHLRSGPANMGRPYEEIIEEEQPIDFVRVLAPDHTVLQTIDGWPAAVVVPVGRGRVLFTTLAARGWIRPRRRSPRGTDGGSPYAIYPDLPVAREPLAVLANEVRPNVERTSFAAADLRPYVTEQIGYAVARRGTTLLVFGSLFAGLAVVALLLGRNARLEHLGWLGPTLALGAAAAFVALGERARTVPATVAVAQLVDAAAGEEEVQLSGLLAAWQPASGSEPLGATDEGHVDLDLSGLEGRVQRRLQTDLGRWHWENLELPSGLRVGPFRYALRTREPVVASVRFGPDGVEGRISAGPFRQLGDAIINAPGQQALAVRLTDGGAFRIGPADLLPPGQFLAGNLLSDQQRDRRQLYAKLFADPRPRFLNQGRVLLAWAEPLPPPFTLAPQPRVMGASLLAIPLRFERTPPDTPVTIPGPFLDFRRVNADGLWMRPTYSGSEPITMRVRYQLPEAVLPLRLEQVRVTAKVNMPTREFTVGGYAGNEPEVVGRFDSPITVQQVDIKDPRLLTLDERGGFQLQLAIGDAAGVLGADGKPMRVNWAIEELNLEVRGRTLGRTE